MPDPEQAKCPRCGAERTLHVLGYKCFSFYQGESAELIQSNACLIREQDQQIAAERELLAPLKAVAEAAEDVCDVEERVAFLNDEQPLPLVRDLRAALSHPAVVAALAPEHP